MATTLDDIRSEIVKFVYDVDQNEKVQKLIRKWNTRILFWGRDISAGFVVEVNGGNVRLIGETNNVDEGKVKVVSDSDTLKRMFRGKENLAHLYLDGIIETYGSEKDQIVLDAVARLLWK